MSILLRTIMNVALSDGGESEYLSLSLSREPGMNLGFELRVDLRDLLLVWHEAAYNILLISGNY